MPSTLQLSSGETFDVITIPKGTVLFRGLFMDRHYSFFTDLFGHHIEGKGYCLDPHHNTFFYPAPFVSDVVNPYPIHAVYIVQYDLDVVRIPYPSKQCRADKESCDANSDMDVCEHDSSSADPCIPPLLIKEYPHIMGYVGLAPHTIPEIVLFPLQSRTQPFMHNRAVDERGFVRFAVEYRSILNYFPLVYITDTNRYAFTDLNDISIQDKLMDANRKEGVSPMVQMQKFIDEALSPGGVVVNGSVFRFTIDMRTGWYRIDKDVVSKHPIPICTDTLRLRNLNDEKQIVPFYFPANFKIQLHGFLMRKSWVSEEDLTMLLSKYQASFQKYYQFHIGNPLTYEAHYKMKAAFPRPDLSPYAIRMFRHYTRKNPRNTSSRTKTLVVR